VKLEIEIDEAYIAELVSVVEFHGVSGKFREAFWPEDIEKQDLFL
jgi:hypothetical protein